MKQQLLILIIVIVSNSLAFSQAIHDSIVSTDSYLKYISYKCLLRDSLKQAALNNNISSIQKLRNISIVFESNEVYYRSRLLTKREDILLQFLLQDYENILKDIKYDLHFFVDQENYRYNEFPAYECGNLTIEIIDFWKNNIPDFERQIINSSLSSEDKDFLILYYKNIIRYIEAGDNLPHDFNQDAKNFLTKHPLSNYTGLAEELSHLERIYITSAVSLNLNFGSGVITGDISNYFHNSFLFGAEIGYILLHYQIKIGYKIHSFSYRDSLRLKSRERLDFSAGHEVDYQGFTTNFGFYFHNSDRLKMKSFISAEINRFVNKISQGEEEKDLRELGKTHYNLNFGLEGGVKLLPIKNVNNYSYFYREEKDKSYTPLFINIGFSYHPSVFKHIEVEGGMWYWYIGLETFVGMQRAIHITRY